jgi:hypothetical protein
MAQRCASSAPATPRSRTARLQHSKSAVRGRVLRQAAPLTETTYAARLTDLTLVVRAPIEIGVRVREGVQGTGRLAGIAARAS